MEILSLPFALFTAVVIGVYYLLAPRAQKWWLLAASYAFYLTWGWPYALVLAALTLVNFWLGLRLKEASQPARLLRAGLLLNLLSFATLKLSASSYGESLFNRLALSPIDSAGWNSVLLPIGFSFYVLQAISYLLDVSRGQCQPSRHLLDFGLYMAYFPRLLSGPIERARTFLPQLARERRVDGAMLARGGALILAGLARKVIVANSLARLMPADLFLQPAQHSLLERAVWLVVFGFKLYNDFAGYTGIVRGISTLLGIELSPNFRQPFFARTFSDFWNRWHISLSHGLRDYIFFPLRRSLLRRNAPAWLALALPPLLTMLASGFWHGVSVAMLLWGALHGLLQIGEQLLLRQKRAETRLGTLLSALGVFLLVTLAWVPFAAGDFSHAAAYLLPAAGLPLFPAGYALQIVLILGFSLLLDALQEHGGETAILSWPHWAQVGSVSFVLLACLLLSGSAADVSGFVYQGF